MRDVERERERERERVFFNRNDGCLGTFQLSSFLCLSSKAREPTIVNNRPA